MFLLKKQKVFHKEKKLLKESIEWLYRHICQHCRNIYIRRPRNKYTDVAESYLIYYKKRKMMASRTRMLKHRIIKLLKSSSGKGTKFTAGTALHSGIHRITRNGFPSYEISLYRKRNCLKAERSVTILSVLTVIIYVPS